MQSAFTGAEPSPPDLDHAEPRLALNKTVALRYRFYLEERGLAAGTINVRMAGRGSAAKLELECSFELDDTRRAICAKT